MICDDREEAKPEGSFTLCGQVLAEGFRVPASQVGNGAPPRTGPSQSPIASEHDEIDPRVIPLYEDGRCWLWVRVRHVTIYHGSRPAERTDWQWRELSAETPEEVLAALAELGPECPEELLLD